jgi:hypothetical protein
MDANTANVLIALTLTYLERAAAAGALLAKTQAEGRAPTPEELSAFYEADDTARNQLQAAIDAARGPVGVATEVGGHLQP